jgi:hypothetical protein
LPSLERTGFLIIENGTAQKGIKRVTVMYDDQQVWNGDVPMGTGDCGAFTIPVPLVAQVFQKPDIKTFRSTKTANFSLGEEN